MSPDFEALNRRSAEVRGKRKETRRALHEARPKARAWSLAAEHVECPEPDISGVEVVKLLGWCFCTGSYEAHKILREADVGEHRLLGELTLRERFAICQRLRAGSFRPRRVAL